MRLTYFNFDEFDFETKVSLILQDGGIVSVVRQDEFVVLLCLYNGFYLELFADPVTYKLVYMEIATTFSMMKHVKKDMQKVTPKFRD